METTMAPAGAAAARRIDARPIRPTGSDTVWDRAVQRRDQLYAEVKAALAAEAIDALVFVSANGNYPPWVKLEAWLPPPGGGDGRERAELLLVVDAKPYHRHPVVVSARATRGKKAIRVEALASLSASQVAEWTRFAVRRGGKPRNYHPVLDALLRPFGWRVNRIDRAYRNGWLPSGPRLLGLGSILLAGWGAADDAVALIPLGVVGLLAAGIWAGRRWRAVFVPEQAVVAPRNLGLVDSWHAVIAELGGSYAEIKQRLIDTISAERGAGLACQTELYGYRTPNGYEERERLVVSKGQALVQVHVYRFNNDLFVGWHAYLNWAQWGETAPVSRKIQKSRTVEFRELRQGYYIPNQLDLIDLSSLSELVHRRIERELKAILKEKEIDQEIDFSIIRGDRDVALDKSRHADQGTPRRGWRYQSTQASGH